MPDRFACNHDYESIFGVGRIEADKLSDDLWRKLKPKIAPLPTNVRMLSIGYGSGRLDLPLITSFARSMDGATGVIHVDALEPNWNDFRERGEARLKEAGFSLADDANVPSGTVRYRRSLPNDIVVDISSTELELAADKSVKNRYDVILCLFTIHLVDDWKKTAHRCLELLAGTGVLVFAELGGSVCFVDGKMPVSGQEDAWSRFWRTVEELRDKLFIPRSRVVSPRSLEALYDSLRMIGGKPVTAQLDFLGKSIMGADLTRIVEEAFNGIEAATFNSLRISSDSLAQQFKNNWTSEILADERLAYDLTIKLTAWPINSRKNHAGCLLGKVTEVLSQRAFQRASDFSHIKRRVKELCTEYGKYTSDSKREALAAMLFNEREALGLSRNSMMHLNSRQGKDSYRTSITLMPKALLGDRRKSEAFADGFGVYVSAGPGVHLSQLGGSDFDCFGQDLTYMVRFNVLTKSGDLPQITCVPACDDTPAALVVDFPPSLVRQIFHQLSAEMNGLKTRPHSLYNGNLFGWNPESGMREYCTYWKDFTKAAALTKTVLGEERKVLLDLDTLPVGKNAIEHLTDELRKAFPLCKENCCGQLARVLLNSCRTRLYFPLESDVSSAVTAIVASSVSSPFIHAKTPSTALLFLLGPTDCQAWGLDAKVIQSKRLLASFEQFRGVVRRAMEIEVGELLIEQGEAEGITDAIGAFGHEVRNSVRKIFANCFQNISDLRRPSEPSFKDDAKSFDANESDWIACPAPEAFEAVRNYLLIHLGDAKRCADIVGLLERRGDGTWSLANGMTRLIEASVRIHAVLLLQESASSRNAAEVVTLWNNQLAQCCHNTPQLMAVDPFEWVPYRSCDTAVQERCGLFVRAFLAACTNAIKNGTSIKVSITVSDGSGDVLVRIVNERNTCEVRSKKYGTAEVLKFLLGMAGVTKPQVVFHAVDMEGNEHEMGSHWLTEFAFPFRVVGLNGGCFLQERAIQ